MSILCYWTEGTLYRVLDGFFANSYLCSSFEPPGFDKLWSNRFFHCLMAPSTTGLGMWIHVDFLKKNLSCCPCLGFGHLVSITVRQNLTARELRYTIMGMGWLLAFFSPWLRNSCMRDEKTTVQYRFVGSANWCRAQKIRSQEVQNYSSHLITRISNTNPNKVSYWPVLGQSDRRWAEHHWILPAHIPAKVTSESH